MLFDLLRERAAVPPFQDICLIRKVLLMIVLTKQYRRSIIGITPIGTRMKGIKEMVAVKACDNCAREKMFS